MNVSELFDLTHWVTENIQGAQISAKYQALQGILQQNSQPAQPQQPFETQKDDLIKSLRAVPLHHLTKDQLRYLAKLGIAQAVGQEAIDTIEDVLFRNPIDPATAASKLQQMLAELDEGIGKSNQIQTGLDEVVVEEEYEAKDEVLIRVSFTGEATMSHVTDFKDWGKTWWEIGRGIAMAHGATPEDVRVVGATKGSIIIELSSALEIAGTASAIILAGLTLAERILNLLKTAEELKGLKLQNKKFAKELKEIAETEKQAGIEQIIADMAKRLKLGDADGEKVNALDRAVKNLVNFTQSGGEVDFVMPEQEVEGEEDAEPSPDYKELRKTSQEIRQLESRIKLLESPKEE